MAAALTALTSSQIDFTSDPEDDWVVVGSKKSLESQVSHLDLTATVREAPPASSRQPLKVTLNAHQDDIHGLLPLSNRTLISGSKDGCLKQWDHEGNLVREIVRKGSIDYRRWITALGHFGSQLWMSGTRDRCIDLWDENGNHIRSFNLYPACNTSTTSKARNMERVLSLVKLTSAEDDPTFLVGWPSQFTAHQIDSDDRLGSAVTHRNDWVYCLTPLAERRVAVVTGAKWEIWEPKNSKLIQWICSATLIRETSLVRGEGAQRPFISSVTPLIGSAHHFGLSLFNGGREEEDSILIYDIEKRKSFFTSPGHQGRTWKIESLNPHQFASCGDEGTVKIWDLRQKLPVISLTDNPSQRARVSSVLKIGDHQIVSASCPDDVKKSADKARLTFWDLR